MEREKKRKEAKGRTGFGAKDIDCSGMIVEEEKASRCTSTYINRPLKQSKAASRLRHLSLHGGAHVFVTQKV